MSPERTEGQGRRRGEAWNIPCLLLPQVLACAVTSASPTLCPDNTDSFFRSHPAVTSSGRLSDGSPDQVSPSLEAGPSSRGSPCHQPGAGPWSLAQQRDRKKKEKGVRIRQGVWPQKSGGDQGGIPGGSSITPGLEEPAKAKAQRWEGRAGTGLRRAVWWGSPQNEGLVKRALDICVTQITVTAWVSVSPLLNEGRGLVGSPIREHHGCCAVTCLDMWLEPH